MARHFKPTEIAGLRPKLVQMLDDARDLTGDEFPFIITDGLRDPGTNAATAGSASNSSHLRGWGVDLRCQTDRARFIMLAALMHVGFTRFGIYGDASGQPHIHVDADPSLPPDVCWIKP